MVKKIYTKDFKVEAAHMALLSSSQQVACDLKLNLSTLNRWVSQHRRDVLENPHRLSTEQELKALKDENAQLKREAKLLHSAAVIFAKC